MHLALTRNTQEIQLIAKDVDHPMRFITKIPCSTMFVCTDSTYSRLIILDKPVITEDELPELRGTKRSMAGRIIDSIPIFGEELDTTTVKCGGVACDETGHSIFVLVLDAPRAYIRVYSLLNYKLSNNYGTWDIPWDDGVVFASTDDNQQVTGLTHMDYHGKITYDSPTTFGCGVTYDNNRLYILTRRKFKASATYSCNMDVLYSHYAAHREDPNREFIPLGFTEFEQGKYAGDSDYYSIWGQKPPYPNKNAIFAPNTPAGDPIFMTPGLAARISVSYDSGVSLDTITITVGGINIITFDVFPNTGSDRAIFDLDFEVAMDATVEIKHTNTVDGASVTLVELLAADKYRWNRFLVGHVRHDEVRTLEYTRTKLHVMNPLSGEILDHYFLSSAFDENDAVFNGITTYDNQVLLGKRWDQQILKHDTRQWHLEKCLDHRIPFPSTAGNILIPVAELKYAAAAVEDLQPAPATMHLYDYRSLFETSFDTIFQQRPEIFKENGLRGAVLQAAIAEESRLRRSINARFLQETGCDKVRGPAEIAKMPIPDETSDHFLPTQEQFSSYPADLVLPESITSDDSERKLFAVYGDRIWTFDCLDYTILVNYPNGLFEGDIIDFGNIISTSPIELPCFIRNDALYTMENVRLMIRLLEDDPRREDIFLKVPGDDMGYREINLGNIAPGESAAFSVRAFAVDVQEWEEYHTHRVPLKVRFKHRSYE